MKEKIKNALLNEYKTLGLTEKAIDGLAAFAETSVKSEEDIEAVVKSLHGLAKSYQADADTIRAAKAAAEKKVLEYEEQIKALKEKPIEKPEPLDIETIRLEFKKSMEEEANRMKSELEQYKSTLQSERRNAFINSEAKKLGIPDVILNNINIDSSLDDAGVTAKLTEIKQVFVNTQIPTNTPSILAKDEVPADEVAEILKLMN